jgi:hypothetical protein
MVATQNLTVYQGADYQQALELRDGSSALIDLTGYTFRGQAKVSYADTDAAFSFSFELRDQVSQTGLVDMSISAASTSALNITKETRYKYDIEMVDTDSKVTRLIQGVVLVYPEVTK